MSQKTKFRTPQDRAQAVLSILPDLAGHPLTASACDAVRRFLRVHDAAKTLTHDVLDDVTLGLLISADPVRLHATKDPARVDEALTRGDIEHIAAEIFRLSERCDEFHPITSVGDELAVRDVQRVYAKPIFVGELANTVRERVMTKVGSRDRRILGPAIRRETAAAVKGRFVQVVHVGGRRAIHTGPFPACGFDVIESVRVAHICAETGAITTTRPAAYS